jgi:haloacetate dehalogenase
VPEGSIRVRYGGSGPPPLLLHGNPRTHRMWNRIASALARSFTVICPDLRGYGEPLMLPATPDHAPYAKREMAKDAVAVMQHFGDRSSRLAGHDRGGRVARRPALDSPTASSARQCPTSAPCWRVSIAPTSRLRSATTIGSGSLSRTRSPRR